MTEWRWIDAGFLPPLILSIYPSFQEEVSQSAKAAA